jgi:leucyl-tRNA synthetase
MGLRRKTHSTLKKITNDFETRYSFNTAIAAIMELLNFIPDSFKDIKASDSNKYCLNESIIIILKTLNPIAPHVSEYLWKNFYGNFSHEEIESSWPEIKEDLLEVSEFELVIQINGKVRGKKLISKELNQDEIELEAKTIENVAANLKNQEIKKVIYIKEKIINFVI